MAIPSPWPLFATQRPTNKASILLDTTCFSTTDFDDFQVVQDHPLPLPSNPVKPPNMQNSEVAELLRRKALSNGVLDTRARYNHPTFPPSTFLTTLIQQERFKEYISNHFGSLNPHLRDASTTTTNQEPLHKEVNATIANSLLNTVLPHAVQVASTEWICKAIFPDDVLPVPFDDTLLDKIPECWDKSVERFSNFPDTMGEHAVQNWLNHLAHTLGIQHGLIKVSSDSADGDVDADESDGVDDVDADESDGVDDDGVDGTDGGVGDFDEVDPERNAYVISAAEDRSFSRVSHKIAPSGGYRVRKPDIILINRNIRHFLKNGERRPRWHHVEAIVEVSLSAPRESMLQQILEKAALMFEAQPFRRFVLGLVLRGRSTNANAEFSFVLVDRVGVCLNDWTGIAGYGAVDLARIVFALSYARPEVLGIDTSMTVDFFSGNVSKIRVQDQEFNVIKHIYSSLVLFGRGTHIFLVQDKDGKSHILKDAWLLANQGMSEITILSTISKKLQEDSSPDAQKFQSMHPRFIVGEEIEDSTKKRRGRASDPPPERLHRRVVTGPVGDTLTSFRSREEFVKVLLDCVDCKCSIQYQSYVLIRLLFRARISAQEMRNSSW
jgi:hypothetical protein